MYSLQIKACAEQLILHSDLVRRMNDVRGPVKTPSQGYVTLIVQTMFFVFWVFDFCSVSGGQCMSPESLRHSPRHSSSTDSAAYTSISLPELPADYSSGRMAAPSPLAPLAAHTLTPTLVTPGVAAMPPSLAARYT